MKLPINMRKDVSLHYSGKYKKPQSETISYYFIGKDIIVYKWKILAVNVELWKVLYSNGRVIRY